MEMLETSSLLHHSNSASLVVRTRVSWLCYHSLSFYHRPCRPQLRCGGEWHACLCFTCVLISPCIAAFLPAQVLDELGRGTATHDGHAIAYGVALHLAQTKRCR